MGGIAVRSFFIRDTLHQQMLAAASASSLKDGSGMSGLEGVHRRLVFWPRVYLDRRSVSTRSEAIPCLLWSHLDPVCCKFRDAFSRFNVISCGLQYGNRIRSVYHPSTAGETRRCLLFLMRNKRSLCLDFTLLRYEILGLCQPRPNPSNTHKTITETNERYRQSGGQDLSCSTDRRCNPSSRQRDWQAITEATSKR
jgi:hypothetical protein